jgi:hypothetical protein
MTLSYPRIIGLIILPRLALAPWLLLYGWCQRRNRTWALTGSTNLSFSGERISVPAIVPTNRHVMDSGTHEEDANQRMGSAYQRKTAPEEPSSQERSRRSRSAIER